MPKKPKQKNESSAESEEHKCDQELWKKVCPNTPLIEKQRKEASEPLYLVRYE